jgi:hypothetical protein
MGIHQFFCKLPILNITLRKSIIIFCIKAMQLVKQISLFLICSLTTPIYFKMASKHLNQCSLFKPSTLLPPIAIKLLLAFFLYFLPQHKLAAQAPDYTAPQGLNNWYFEAGGPAIFYSLNYEKYLYRTYDEQYTWTAHVGLGYNPINFDILNTVYLPSGTVMAPFSATILKGAGKEKLEIGGGFTLFTQDFNDNQIVPHAVIGLRVMESNNICFRMNYVPFLKDNSITHWVGISLGKNFSFKKRR